jgi:hypothetical protein
LVLSDSIWPRVLLQSLIAAWMVSTTPAQAGSLDYCHPPVESDAAVQDRLLEVAAVLKTQLESSGHRLALISRSGLALQRLGQRYSHTGISLQASQHTPWSVRQLYFACDEQKPRIFDQGLSGFVLGVQDADEAYVSLVFLPEAAQAQLERAALDDQLSLQLLAAHYSANAYAFSTRYQNCNQWIAELMASAWGDLPIAGDLRNAAQQWLTDQNYQPTVLDIGWHALMWLADRLRWLHSDDHPAADLGAAQFRISMPQSLEHFARQRYPDSRRIELCYTPEHIVIHTGWSPIARGCTPAIADKVIPFQAQPSPEFNPAPP